MFYTVAEVAEKLNLSKQGVYNKLKINEIKAHTSKKQGVTYIDEIGLKLIEDSLNNFVEVEVEQPENAENKPFNEDLKDVETFGMIETDFINYLKAENERLWEQVNHLSRLVENGQVLLKEKPHENIQLLEEHFVDLEEKIETVKIHMTERSIAETEKRKGIIERIFGTSK